MIFTGNLGYPRIGKKRETKFALEAYWNGSIEINDLRKTANTIQRENLKAHQKYGIDFIPNNDFSLYDHVLDHIVMFDAIPARFDRQPFQNPEDLLFTMARGGKSNNGEKISAMEMTKWFNSNYHYIVPEIDQKILFSLNEEKLLSDIQLGRDMGIETRPIIIGPVTFLKISKSTANDFSPLERLPDLLPIYKKLFKTLQQNHVDWIQLDEPIISTDLAVSEQNAYFQFFSDFSNSSERPKIMLTSYFSDLSTNIELVRQSPFEGLHIDLTESHAVEKIISNAGKTQIFSLGIIDGRNIWRNDIEKNIADLEKYITLIGDRDVVLSSSCSMLHLPIDINLEDEIDPVIRSWMAFAEQKLEALTMLKRVLGKDPAAGIYIKANKKAIQDRKESTLVHSLTDSPDLDSITEKIFNRTSPFLIRKELQKKELGLPLLPTTTIGSFPQTKEIRSARSKYNKGILEEKDYISFLENEITKTIQKQEELGIDVLVHGEFERNDMVQYFAEKLSGFVFTKNGWVQSFGSRYVRPPIIFGDVHRPKPMTVEWTKFAQTTTKKHVKGMLTGPVTILQWSFVRDDQLRSETCKQIALSIRDEVQDLEKAGTKIIQIDEPALREGLPLQRKFWKDYLDWSVKCFKIASSGVKDETQIHTHMCYAEFNDIIDAIIDMDADVISIEASRSKMDLLNAFQVHAYPNEIGPGIYDIHSPIVPSTEELVILIEKALSVIPQENLWINPDCGLKTRKWDEVLPSLKNMVAAANLVRERYKYNK